ncbi:MAG: nicotinate-nucleotide adenylyltransferase [Anaerolineae bacterium]
MSKKRIGIFGGTFDPPHLGHLILASEACAQLHLSRLLWVLTPSPPHKRDQTITPLEHRHAMLELALADDPTFELSLVEMNRPGPHYTVDTLHLIAEANPGADLVLLIGGDSLRDLPGWHRPHDLLAACHEIGVMRRPGALTDLDALEASLPGIRSKIRFVEAPLLEIASREIRRRIAQGLPFRYYLPPAVYQYIVEHQLYK